MSQLLEQEVRIGIVTDIHCGPDRPTRPGSQALELLNTFIDTMNASFAPGLVVNLGDTVQDSAEQEDEENLRRVQRAFQDLRVRTIHLLGNHDVRNLSKHRIYEILAADPSPVAVEYCGLQLILLDTQDPVIEGTGGALSDRQLDWLQSTLEASCLPTLVFSHHPLDDQDVQSNRNFDPFPRFAHAEGRHRARALMEASGRVLAVFSGHVHWSRIEVIHGIPYYSVPSLTEAWKPNGVPQGGYVQLSVHTDLSVEVEMRKQASSRRFLVRRGCIQAAPNLHSGGVA